MFCSMNVEPTGCRLDNLRKKKSCISSRRNYVQQTSFITLSADLEDLLCSDGLKYGVFSPNSPFPTQLFTENKTLARDFIFKIQTDSVSLQIMLPVNFHLYLLLPLEQCETLQSSYLLPKQSFQTGITSDSSQLEGLVNLGHLLPISWHNLKCQKFRELMKFVAEIFWRCKLL